MHTCHNAWPWKGESALHSGPSVRPRMLSRQAEQQGTDDHGVRLAGLAVGVAPAGRRQLQAEHQGGEHRGDGIGVPRDAGEHDAHERQRRGAGAEQRHGARRSHGSNVVEDDEQQRGHDGQVVHPRRARPCRPVVEDAAEEVGGDGHAVHDRQQALAAGLAQRPGHDRPADGQERQAGRRVDGLGDQPAAQCLAVGVAQTARQTPRAEVTSDPPAMAVDLTSRLQGRKRCAGRHTTASHGRFCGSPGLQPVGGRPALGGGLQLVHRRPVDRLPDDVGVAGVAGRSPRSGAAAPTAPTRPRRRRGTTARPSGPARPGRDRRSSRRGLGLAPAASSSSSEPSASVSSSDPGGSCRRSASLVGRRAALEDRVDPAALHAVDVLQQAADR